MRTPARRASSLISPPARAGLALLACLSIGCEQGVAPVPPSTGALRVTVLTTGGDQDLDGYTVTIDTTAIRIGNRGAVVLASLPGGAHTVLLSGLAENCSVVGENPRQADVTTGDTLQVIASVACVSTGVSVSASTTGPDPDPDGYTITLDGVLEGAVAYGGGATITRLAATSHTLVLGGIAPNCVATTPTIVVNVSTRSIAPVTFDVRCTATTGSARVSLTTSGGDVDPDGYLVSINGSAPHPVGANGSSTFDGLSTGDHTLALAGLAPNCSIDGSSLRTVHVTTGAATRDTVTASFAVACTATTGVLLISTITTGVIVDPDGYMMQLDGGASIRLVSNGGLVIDRVSVGDHSASLTGLASNCSVAGGASRSVHMTAGGLVRDTVRITWEVSCAASLQVTITATGFSPPRFLYGNVCVVGDEFCADWGYQRFDVGVAVALTVAPGDYEVPIYDLPFNCKLVGDSVTRIRVVADTPTHVTIAVTCLGIGTVRVTAGASGMDLSSAYALEVDGRSMGWVYDGGNAFLQLVEGPHTIRLTPDAANCVVAEPNPRPVTVATDMTLAVTFPVSCAPLPVVRVTVTTTGSNGPTWFPAFADAPSYYDADYGNIVDRNGVATFQVPVGAHSIYLGVSGGCVLTSPSPIAVQAQVDSTIDVGFGVSCP